MAKRGGQDVKNYIESQAKALVRTGLRMNSTKRLLQGLDNLTIRSKIPPISAIILALLKQGNPSTRL
jgi:hypothetical protein